MQNDQVLANAALRGIEELSFGIIKTISIGLMSCQTKYRYKGTVVCLPIGEAAPLLAQHIVTVPILLTHTVLPLQTYFAVDL